MSDHVSTIRFRAGYDWSYDCISLLAGVQDRDGWFQIVAKPIEWNERQRSTATPSEPTLRMDHAGAQSLMDALWGVGVRPTEVGTAGQLSATERHLTDMRRIAFGKLNLDEPK